jgi:hypothetical protein
MALIKINSQFMAIQSMADGNGDLDNFYLDLPKVYREDWEQLKADTEATHGANSFGGIAPKVLEFTPVGNGPVSLLVFVAIDDDTLDKTYDENDDWVILACPPADRENDQTSKKYTTQQEITDLL